MHLLVGVALVWAYFASSPSHLWQPEPQLVATPAQSLPSHDRWQMRFASDADTKLVHAASMVELPDGRLRAFWFAGSREGAADVAIHSAVFDPETGIWSDETPVVTRQQLIEQWGRHVRKLGNAVPVLDSDGTMRLFLVAVSFGGWAASRLVVMESADHGQTWQFAKALGTTPFLNISTLVKTPPVHYSDGTIGLPVYHEMVGKFGELLRLDEDNRVMGKARIGHGRKAIQPLVLVDDAQHAAAFLRNENSPNNGKLYQSFSQDGGWTWSELEYAPLDNPSSALGGVSVKPGHWLVATNCNSVERDDLCIRETRDSGESWHRRWMFHDRQAWRGKSLLPSLFMDLVDDEVDSSLRVEAPQRLLRRVKFNECKNRQCGFQYDYPYMVQTRNGDLHVLYTWNKSAIRHAWLKADPQEEEDQDAG